MSKENQRVEVAVFANLGDGSFAAPVTYTVGGADLEYAMAIAAGDFNGDGVTDIAVTTMGEASPPAMKSVSAGVDGSPAW